VDDAAELDGALSARTPPRDVPVRVTAFVLPDEDPAKVSVLVVAEVGVHQERSALASIAVELLDAHGQRRAYALRRLELAPLPSGALAFRDTLTVEPGAYRLRVAALRNSAVGTAEATVGARFQGAGTVRAGDLLIGDLAGDHVAADAGVDRRVGGIRLVASLPLGVPDLMVTVAVAKDAQASALLSGPAPLLPPGEGRTRIAQAVLDARLLPSGAYLATATVNVAGKEVVRVTAPFAVERSSGSIASAGLAVPFSLDEVLEPGVVGPFLDELESRASQRARGAIGQAKAGHFVEAADSVPPGDSDDPARPFLLGLSLISRKQLQAASDAFREALRAAPDFFVGAFYIGACYAAGGRDPQAVNAWQTSLVGLDDYPVVFRLLGDALSRMGRPDRAVETLDEALSKWPDDRVIRLRLAKAALDARRYDRVFEVVDGGLARAGASPDLLLAGMQAIVERVTRTTDSGQDDPLVRLRRYRDAYVAAGGQQQPLVAEWVAAVEKKILGGRHEA
jgi:tetratricopeptide (TPR) repeat protein